MSAKGRSVSNEASAAALVACWVVLAPPAWSQRMSPEEQQRQRALQIERNRRLLQTAQPQGPARPIPAAPPQPGTQSYGRLQVPSNQAIPGLPPELGPCASEAECVSRCLVNYQCRQQRQNAQIQRCQPPPPGARASECIRQQRDADKRLQQQWSAETAARNKEIAEARRVAAEKAKADAEAAAIKRARELRDAKKLADAEAKKAALADGANARKHKVDMTVCGVPLGVPLDLPDCEEVGKWEEGLVGKRMVSEKTCVLLRMDGTSAIHFGDKACPGWMTGGLAAGLTKAFTGADDIATELKDDVLVSVKLGFMSGAVDTRGGAVVTSGLAGAVAAGLGAGVAEAGYQSATVEARENIAASHKDLRRKYGKPTRSEPAVFKLPSGEVARKTDEPEWVLPGLHVLYEAQQYRDTVTIELASIAKARADAEKAAEAAAPKL